MKSWKRRRRLRSLRRQPVGSWRQHNHNMIYGHTAEHLLGRGLHFPHYRLLDHGMRVRIRSGNGIAPRAIDLTPFEQSRFRKIGRWQPSGRGAR
jgi:hypothetical protein